MKIKELRSLSKEELAKKIKDGKEKLRQLRFDLTAGKVKNVREIRHIKKEIARINTLLNPKIQEKTTIQNQSEKS
jgi:large subunit ribosomal protein L29